VTREREFHGLYAQLRIHDQLEFYRARRDEYARANSQTIVVRNVFLALAAIAGILSQAPPESWRGGWAVAGAVFGALAAAVTAYGALIGFPQLAKLYGDAVRNLEEAVIDWDVAHPSSDLTNEVERVEGIFRSEIGQWGQLIVKDAQPAPPTDPAETPPAP
jgi:hypothetical protein